MAARSAPSSAGCSPVLSAVVGGIIILGTFVLVISWVARNLPPVSTPTVVARAAVPAALPSASLQPGPVHPALTASSGDTSTPAPTSRPSLTPVPPTATPTPIYATARSAANLRGGPGTNYAIQGGLAAGQRVAVVFRTAAGDWLRTADGAWVSASLLDAPGAELLPVVMAPAPPSDTPFPTATPAGVYAAQAGGIAVYVKPVGYYSHLSYYSPAAGMVFAAFSVMVVNASGQPIHVNPLNVTLITGRGLTYAYSTATYTQSNALQAVDVQPGARASGIVIFQIPADAAPIRAVYESFLGPTITVDLTSPPDF